MKKEWKKREDALYLPKSSPEIIEVPEMKCFVLCGGKSHMHGRAP